MKIYIFVFNAKKDESVKKNLYFVERVQSWNFQIKIHTKISYKFGD